MAKMDHHVNSYLSDSDLVVLENLLHDVRLSTVHQDTDCGATHQASGARESDSDTVTRLMAMNDPTSPDFAPTVFVSWDDKDIHPFLNRHIVHPYARLASRIVRHPTDIVFFTHILMYLFVNLPSALYLFYNFSYLHGVLHTGFTFWCIGSFTLMMHNHIHNNGVLAKEWYWLDVLFPYVTEPLLGHTWHSYYFHHIKHHHIEGNGPYDLSSTIRYQRDDVMHFLHYVGRFIFLIWAELPIYFIRKNRPWLALQTSFWELSSYLFIYQMTCLHLQAGLFVFVLPFALLRLGLMIGNWGQHALVDEVDPDSDFRSSITLIDVPSNRFCFNDGYHTSHHLNPLRHWRDHPVHFVQSKEAYATGRALVFHNIDYLMMTITLLRKDYAHLADCLIPIGDQVGMSKAELAAMLRTKTRRFTEEDIKKKFRITATSNTRRWSSAKSNGGHLDILMMNLAAMLDSWYTD